MSGPPPTAAAVLVAAGNSTRMNAGGVPGRKPWLELAGRSVLEHTLAAFDAAETVSEVVVVAHADDVDAIRRLAAARPAFAKVRGVVPGGAERADSVREGVAWCSFEVDVVAVHDAARPLIEPARIDAAVRAAAEAGGALVALAVRDTIKETDDPSADPVRVDRTLDRSRLLAAQTPQAFRAREFRACLESAAADAYRPSDDAALWERYVGPVVVVPGTSTNLKITSPEDLALAEALLRLRTSQETPS